MILISIYPCPVWVIFIIFSGYIDKKCCDIYVHGVYDHIYFYDISHYLFHLPWVVDVDDHRVFHFNHVNFHSIIYDSDDNTLYGHCNDIN